MFSRSIKQFSQCKSTIHEICDLLYCWSERSTWKSKRKSPGFLLLDLLSFEIKLKFMSSNRDFLAHQFLLYAPSSQIRKDGILHPRRVAATLPLPQSLYRRTHGCTLTLQPKFLASIAYQICLPMVLRPCGLRPQRARELRYNLKSCNENRMVGTRGFFLASVGRNRPETWPTHISRHRKPRKKSLWHPGYENRARSISWEAHEKVK